MRSFFSPFLGNYLVAKSVVGTCWEEAQQHSSDSDISDTD